MLSPTLAKLPALSVGALLLGMVFIVFGTATGYELQPLRPLALILGVFMLLLTVVSYAIHLIFTLMRDHEAWKRQL